MENHGLAFESQMISNVAKFVTGCPDPPTADLKPVDFEFGLYMFKVTGQFGQLCISI